MRRSAALSLLLLLTTASAVAQAQSGSRHDMTPTVAAAPLSGELRIDGRLDEAAWGAATPVTLGTQLDPDEGKPPTERTEVRVLYDDRILYVGVTCRDCRFETTVEAQVGNRDLLGQTHGVVERGQQH